MIFGVVFALLGAFTIFTGIKIIVTGKVSASEERKLVGLPEKSVKAYKVLNSVLNIVIGLLMIGLAVVRILSEQGIIEDKLIYTIIFLGIAIVLLGVYFLIWMKIKKDAGNGQK